MIYVVATLTVKPETRAEFIAAATACIKETRKEPGNIAYDLHESVTDHLHLGMAVAEMPGKPRKLAGARGGDLMQRLGLADDAHHGAVVEHQTVAVPQRGRLRQVKQQDGATLGGQHQAAPMALARIEHDAVDRRRVVPLSRLPHRKGPPHD